MVEGRLGEAQEAEEARPAAIDPCQRPQQAHRREDHERHVDHRAGAHRRHEGHLLGGGRDGPLGLRIEGRQELALGDGEPVVGVDDLVGQPLQAAAVPARRSPALRRGLRAPR